MMLKKKKVIIIAIILFALISTAAEFYIRDSKLKRADYKNGKLVFDGKCYKEISYTEIGSYNETWKIVRKTTDGVWTIYEIEQYPEQEYLVARTSWEARVLKQVN